VARDLLRLHSFKNLLLNNPQGKKAIRVALPKARKLGLII